MNKFYRNIFVFLLAALCTAATLISFNIAGSDNHNRIKIRSTSSPHASVEMKAQRLEYFLKMLRDPATGKIPEFIRQRELAFAKKLSSTAKSLQKTSAITWNEAGPYDVGGRTRALAVDINNPNIILAGGASGGIWKSTDKGVTWVAKSTNTTILSVTSIAQDPRPGFTTTWYYSTGEFSGSGNDLGFTARFTGDGIYKSTDNGETWQVLPSTLSANTAGWDSDFDFVLKIVVNPANGNIFVASNGSGIFRSTDGGTSFSHVLGDANNHIFSDISVGSNGTLVAVLSRAFNGITPTSDPGVYKSVNNGNDWTDITPASYASTSMRSVVQVAPSNSNTAYVLTQTGAMVNEREEIKFYKINVGNGTSADRSNNLPDYSALGGVASSSGFLTTQGGYDMVVAVKPDDENFVMIAGTSMFRSTDGFATKPAANSNKNVWLGGYHPVNFGYPNFHPDIHSFAFDPTSANKMWWGHDGGLSYTEDIRNSSFAELFPWENKNNGYNVTQFYHISISNEAGDTRVMGGTQDNGSPYFRYTGTDGSSEDVSSGDGSFSYMGQNFAYTSSQNGNVSRLRYDTQGNPSFNNGWSRISPTGASNQGFINPFCVDPNNENIMYYPAGDVLWRNNQLGSIPDFLQDGTSVGWTRLDNLALPSGYSFSAMNVSTTPANVLYYGASGFGAPKIFKLTNSANATSGAADISIQGAPEGAYVHGIAVNPDDANEIIVVLSNYNIIGLYHSINGGQSYTPIEGNLQGNENNPGPSLRSASILPSNNGKTYFVATSIGLFSTSQINGNNTVWTQEGANTLGNVIVNYVVSRKSDGLVVAGTHGRGIFTGTSNGTGGGNAVLSLNAAQLSIEVLPGGTRTGEITISNTGDAPLTYSVSAVSGTGLDKRGNAATINTFAKPVKSSFKFGNSEAGRKPSSVKAEKLNKTKPSSVKADDVIILDDGNETADEFLGWQGGDIFMWGNEFYVDNNFTLKAFNFFGRSESAMFNNYTVGVYDTNLTALAEGYATFNNSPQGEWYTINLDNQLSFNAGQKFYIIIQSSGFVNFPAGVDFDGAVTGKSYYFYLSQFYNLNTVDGYANGAFLIRAVGTFSGSTQNQSPVANAQVTPNPANVNDIVNFNGSGSSDADGQIIQHLWDFGDGSTGTQAVATHSYTQAGQYNYTLTVIDDKGAPGVATGQIVINGEGTPSRWTITPANGTVPAGGSQTVSIRFDAVNLAEGNYTAQLNISSNGGNSSMPVDITVSSTVDVAGSSKNFSYKLEQNYPNPFNPSTTIRWELAKPGNVSIKVYNISGEEIATLVDDYRDAGTYQTMIDMNNINNGKALSSGVYFYRISSGNYSDSRKFVLLK